jgi:hypothetical protein
MIALNVNNSSEKASLFSYIVQPVFAPYSSKKHLIYWGIHIDMNKDTDDFLRRAFRPPR